MGHENATPLRTPDAAVEVLVHQVGRMANDMDEMKQSMKELSQNMSRLALAEERITQTNAVIERLFKAVEVLTARVGALEQKAVIAAQTGKWVDKIVWLVFGAAVTTVLVKSGFVH